jgi:cell fate (sporulation/competence/biofilm development) regulator YmcA (YheA/YmcA/DUF963 family)
MYRIALSKPEQVATINQRLADGRAIRVNTRLRNIELEIIYTCLNEFAKHVQKCASYLQVIKHMNAVQKIADTIQFINFSKSDFENLIAGFEMTKGNRPDSWTTAINFFEQMEGPEEIEIEDTVQKLKDEIDRMDKQNVAYKPN